MKSEFYIFAPSTPLNQWVQFFWISKGENDTTKSKVLPNGSVELILNFGAGQKTLDINTFKTEYTFKKFWIAGLQHKPIVIQSVADTNLLGIRFLPGGVFPFFKFPLTEISDAVVEADWLSKELCELCEKINDLSDHRKIILLAENYLWSKLDGSCLTNESVRYVANRIFFSEEQISVKELVRKSGYSHKHFIALFKSQVGTTPKNLQRVIRLQNVIKTIKGKENVKWSDILYRFSYYDPPHFVYDFKELTGMTPDQYLASRTFDENHCVIR